jgi:toxin ParE1/3/4
MAALIWTEPALQDLDAIADYIALENPIAARELVRRVFQHVEQLQAHPESGSFPPELRRSSRRYRQIVEPPCRVFYRYDRRRKSIFVLYVIRGEMRLRKSLLRKRH